MTFPMVAGPFSGISGRYRHKAARDVTTRLTLFWTTKNTALPPGRLWMLMVRTARLHDRHVAEGT